MEKNCGFEQWQNFYLDKVEQNLNTFLPPEEDVKDNTNSSLNLLHKAMRYSVLNGGKRIRALLVYATAELYKNNVSENKFCLLDRIACALEIIHSYSLVHDDLPAMDNDTLRRGKPTCHVAFGEANALLVGDALQSMAFEILSEDFSDNNNDILAKQSKLVNILAKSSGSLGMAGGQAIDLNAVGINLTENELQKMHELKTGKLILAPILMAAVAMNFSKSDTILLTNFGKKIGLLFQIVDDILDCIADPKLLGKSVGKDAQNHKPTYVSLQGLENAKNQANLVYRSAISDLSKFGEQATILQSLTDLIAKRAF